MRNEIDDELQKVIYSAKIIRDECGCNKHTAANRALINADTEWLNAMYEMYDLTLVELIDYIVNNFMED